jgi:hypothetical protein
VIEDAKADPPELDPAELMAAQRFGVIDALGAADPADAQTSVHTYLDLEERIIVDMAERVAPDEDYEVPSREHVQQLRSAPTRSNADRSRARELFDRHVRETEDMFHALWTHLDATGRHDVASALEEARLSREEFDQSPPSHGAQSRGGR